MVREKKGVDFEGQVRERERDFQALAHRLTKDVLTKPFVTHTRAHMCVCCVAVQLDGTQRGVRVKSQAGRGGVVQNITYSNMQIRNVEVS